MTHLPPLDLHAHVDPAIDRSDLDALDGVVFAVTRSLAEAAVALDRTDDPVVWGVGCHPGLARAQKGFSVDEFARLLDQTPFVGEFGLDGSSRVAMSVQRATLRMALSVLAQTPRLVSLHSHGATEALIEELEATPIRGAILHWWLGDAELTRRAIDLGCYFSVNASSVRNGEVLDLIPRRRLLTETDHPFGDRYASQPRKPGNVDDAERSIARRNRAQPLAVRRRLWQNLGDLVRETGCGALLPLAIQSTLTSLPVSE